MSHLKVYLRFHFKKHKNLQKHFKKKMHLTLQLKVHLKMHQGYTFESLYASFISYIEQKKNRIVDILKLDSEADVHRCLQPFTEKGLFMSIFFTKVADRKPEKRLHQRCFPVSLPNIAKLFFVKHVCETLSIFFVASTSSAKYYSRPWLYSDYL